ncbi:hypothetical protein RCL1_005274 [Eukaryota sp. TZLM3-RCL]
MHLLDSNVIVVTTDNRIIRGTLIAYDYLGDILLSSAEEAFLPQGYSSTQLSGLDFSTLLWREVSCCAIPQNCRVQVYNFLCFQCPNAENSQCCTKPLGLCGKDSDLEALHRNVLASSLSLALHIIPLEHHYQDVSLDVFNSLFTWLSMVSVSENYDPELAVFALKDLAKHRNDVDFLLQQGTAEISKNRLSSWVIGQNKSEMIDNGQSFSSLALSFILDSQSLSLAESILTGLLPGLSKLLVRANYPLEIVVNVLSVMAKISSLIFNKGTSADFLRVWLKMGDLYDQASNLIDEEYRSSFGAPSPITVDVNLSKPGPAVLVYGDSLNDLYKICQTLGESYSIYTCGNLFKAHAFPELKKFLSGHFSSIWQDQRVDFEAFPGIIILLNGPVLPLHFAKSEFLNRTYTYGSCGIPGVKHVKKTLLSRDFDWLNSSIISSFDPHAPASLNIYLTSCYYHWHNRLRLFMPEFAECIASNKIENILVFCGSEAIPAKQDPVFMKLLVDLPPTTVIFTFGSVRFRLLSAVPELSTDFSISRLFPRLMDLGSFEDIHSFTQVLLLISSALKKGIPELPLTVVLSWYEAESLCLLSVLNHYGLAPIAVTPSLPVHFDEELVENFSSNFGVLQLKQ